jgi:hypothetical protein
VSRIITVRGRRLLVWDRDDWLLGGEWRDSPSYTVADVHTEVGHYPGAGSSWKPPLDTAAHIRFSHGLYLVGRGYNYGYGGVIGANPIDWDADPVVTDMWIVRGFEFRNAANNGDFEPYSTTLSPWNGKTHSWQVMCSDAFPPTEDQRKQFRYALAWSDDVHDELLDLKKHRDSDSTDCPGPLAQYIDDGSLSVRPSPPVEPQPDPEPTFKGGKVLVLGKFEGEFWVSDGIFKRHLRGPQDVLDMIRVWRAKDYKKGKIERATEVSALDANQFRDFGWDAGRIHMEDK